MVIFIYPNALFEDNDLLDKNNKNNKNVYIIESPTYFTLFKYHKLKLILHRATMKYYADFIKKKYKCNVTYIDFYDFDKLKKIIKGKDDKIDMHDAVDHIAIKNIKKIAKANRVELIIHETPLFINKISDLDKSYKNKKTFSHHHFYTRFRKKYNILMKDGKPIGGNWSFDTHNRESFPENFKDKFKIIINNNKYIVEATKYINKHFKNNPGSTDFYLPITHNEAKKHFKKFLKQRFKCFGPYQDAVSKDIVVGCHSIISPLLNIGLLTPDYVIKEADKYGRKHKVPMQSIEGFIRQLSWREYVRMLYMFKRKEFENKNYFNHRRKLKNGWFKIKNNNQIITNFPVIDDQIHKAFKYGYLHHIERLMYIGNYMLIIGIKPTDCFKWFMELFIDSYNWVMYPNVYGMSQHSAGPIMMKRPYFSSSNYINRMSDYQKSDWFETWDALYYAFINDNKKLFSKNYATAAQVRHWNNKSDKEKKDLLSIAKKYLKNY